MKKNTLALAVCSALCLPAAAALAQSQSDDTAGARSSVTTTSNTTNSNATKRVQQLDAVSVTGQSLSLGGGNMQVQVAPKAVSTIGREAILKAAPGANFTQMLSSIPGAISATNDVTGLNDGAFTVRGYPADEVGVTVNGVPINDSGNYKIYATEYGDTENMGDITVEQGYPSVTSPVIGAAGGNIAWVTVDPTREAGVDLSQSLGSNGYRRTFVRYNTGDLGPVRSWFSYSNNQTDLWRGDGESKVTKVDAKSVWTIDADNSVTASLQYNREFKNNYRALTKAQANADYHLGYDRSYSAASPATYAGLQTNPFTSAIVSLDGEFALSDSLHLSVVPYFVYGYGGGGSGTTLSETSGLAAGSDLNANGVIAGAPPVYQFYTSDTFRPGLHVKFKQDLGLDDSLEYGFLYERPRQQQAHVYSMVDPAGNAADLWGHENRYLLTFANGNPLYDYRSYSVTDTKRLFATNTWTPNDQWTVSVGGAYTAVERKGWYYNRPGSGYAVSGTSATAGELYASGRSKYEKFTPSAGVKFQLDERNQFYLGVGQSYRAPINNAALNAFYNDAYAAATGKSTSLDQAEPESAWTADLGWRFYGDKVSAVLDAYASKFKNKQFSGTDPATFAPVYIALGKVDMRGVNGELSYTFNDTWSAYASYAYTEAEMKDDLVVSGVTYATDGNTLVNVPRHAGYAALNFTQGPFWASLSGNVQSSIWGTFRNTEKSGGFAVVNLNGGWNFADAGWLKKPYLKLNLYNLGNRKALTYSTSTSGTATTATYQLLQDRTLMATVGASFDL